MSLFALLLNKKSFIALRYKNPQEFQSIAYHENQREAQQLMCDLIKKILELWCTKSKGPLHRDRDICTNAGGIFIRDSSCNEANGM